MGAARGGSDAKSGQRQDQGRHRAGGEDQPTATPYPPLEGIVVGGPAQVPPGSWVGPSQQATHNHSRQVARASTARLLGSDPGRKPKRLSLCIALPLYSERPKHSIPTRSPGTRQSQPPGTLKFRLARQPDLSLPRRGHAGIPSGAHNIKYTRNRSTTAAATAEERRSLPSLGRPPSPNRSLDVSPAGGREGRSQRSSACSQTPTG